MCFHPSVLFTLISMSKVITGNYSNTQLCFCFVFSVPGYNITMSLEGFDI